MVRQDQQPSRGYFIAGYLDQVESHQDGERRWADSANMYIRQVLLCEVQNHPAREGSKKASDKTPETS